MSERTATVSPREPTRALVAAWDLPGGDGFIRPGKGADGLHTNIRDGLASHPDDGEAPEIFQPS
jgi:hypothetical protein